MLQTLQNPWLIALMNLSGLGFGYLALGRRLRWLFYLIGSMALAVGLLLLPDVHPYTPGLYIALGLWLLWMSFDGWRVARKAPGERKRLSPVWVIVSLLPSLGLAAGVLFYQFAARQTLQRAEAYYQDSQYTVAGEAFSAYMRMYRHALTVDLSAAAQRTDACALLALGQAKAQAADYPAALQAYSDFTARYPGSGKAEEINQATQEISLAWAHQKARAGDYPGALQAFRDFTTRYPGSDKMEEINQATQDVSLAWAHQKAQEGDYPGALQAFSDFTTRYPASGKEAEIHRATLAVYLNWADQKAQAGDYQGAVDTYEKARQYDGSASVELRQKIAATLLEWGRSLAKEEQFLEALGKFRRLKQQYPELPEADQAVVEINTIYLTRGEKLRQEKKYEQAIQMLREPQKQTEDRASSEKASRAITGIYLEWGKQLASMGTYAEALEKLELTQSSTRDAAIKKEADAIYQDTLQTLSTDSGPEGSAIINQVQNQYCSNGPAVVLPVVGIAGPWKAVSCDIGVPQESLAVYPAHLRYYLRMRTLETTVESCPYTGNHTLYRERTMATLELLDVLTGEKVASERFNGSMPGPCPARYAFRSAVQSIVGGAPDTSKITAWLKDMLAKLSKE